MPCVSFLQGTFPTSHYRPGTGVGTEEFFDTKVRGPCPPEYHGLVGEANAWRLHGCAKHSMGAPVNRSKSDWRAKKKVFKRKWYLTSIWKEE